MACRQPFSRHASRRGAQADGRTPDERFLAAYEFAAHEYTWSAETIRETLTNEQLVAYLDAAQDRIEQASRVSWNDLIEAVRAGTLFAHDQKAYDRWRAEHSGHGGKSLRDLARDLGGGQPGGIQVVRGEFEFRN